MRQISQTQQSNQSQNSQNSCPPTQDSQESSWSTHYGAGYNDFDYGYFKEFEKGTDGYYDPDFLRKNAEERRKRDQECWDKATKKSSWVDECVSSCQGNQFSQVLSTQGTSEAEWFDNGDVRGISNVETSIFTQETEAVDDDEVVIVGLSQVHDGGRTFDCDMDDDFGNSSDEENKDPDPNSHEGPKSQTIGTSVKSCSNVSSSETLEATTTKMMTTTTTIATERPAAAVTTTASSMNNHEYLQQTTTTTHTTMNLFLVAITNKKEYQVVVKVRVIAHVLEAKMMIKKI